MWKTPQPFSEPESLGFYSNLHKINEINELIISLLKLNIAMKLFAHVDWIDNSRRHAELWDTFYSMLWEE